MIVNEEMLKNFEACDKTALAEFSNRYPDGLDISDLWKTKKEASKKWNSLLADEFLKKKIGWAIISGLLPSRIRADLRGADLSDADLWDADLRGADLRGADLRGADLRGAVLRDAKYDKYTILSENIDKNGMVCIDD